MIPATFFHKDTGFIVTIFFPIWGCRWFQTHDFELVVGKRCEPKNFLNFKKAMKPKITFQ